MRQVCGIFYVLKESTKFENTIRLELSQQIFIKTWFDNIHFNLIFYLRAEVFCRKEEEKILAKTVEF